MSQYIIEIDDKSVTDQINGIINAVFKREINSKYGETGHEISQAVKDIVYSHKDEIIDRVVDRAVKEIVRKGLPKLLEKGGEGWWMNIENIMIEFWKIKNINW